MKSIRIITGTGRSGTTALIQLLARMGKTDISRTYYNDEVNGGNEVVMGERMKSEHLVNLPPIIKDPRLLFNLGDILATNPELSISHAWLCVRDVDDVIASRAAYGLTWGSNGDPREFLIRGMGLFLNDCATFGIPVTVLRYPDFLLNKWGLFDEVMKGLGIIPENRLDVVSLRKNFSAAYDEVIKPDLIGAYKQREKK